MRSPEFNTRADRLAAVDRAISRIRRCTIAYVLFSTWFYNARAIAGPDAASGQDGAAPAILATPAGNVAEGPSPADAGAPPLARTQPAQQDEAKVEKDQKQASDATSSEKKGEWLLAPIPISSPAIGSGLE